MTPSPECSEHERSVELARALVVGQAKSRAETLLKGYLSNYDGRLFDSALNHDHSDQITSEDLAALRFLSVGVSPTIKDRLLEPPLNMRITELLQQIPIDRDIWTISAEEFEVVLGDKSPARELWNVLKAALKWNPRWSGRAVTAGKLVHGKRPRLIPIFDSEVQAALRPPRGQFWRTMWCVMRDEPVREALTAIQRAVPAASDLSLLRVMDIVAWRSRGK